MTENPPVSVLRILPINLAKSSSVKITFKTEHDPILRLDQGKRMNILILLFLFWGHTKLFYLKYNKIAIVLCLIVRFFQSFDVKAHGAEAIVAGDHGRKGIFHPAIVKIAAPIG